MTRRRHPRKEVEEAIRYAEESGWRVEVGGSHAWGKMYCPYIEKECRCGEFCISSISSTPRNAATHAKQIRKVIDNCTEREDQVQARALDMSQYDFTLKFALAQQDADPQIFVEQLLAEGCDDALIGIGQYGRIALNFTREASSAGEAVLSALSDVQRIVPGARLVEASPDFVGLTDIANMLGFSRQHMRKLVMKNGSTFPLPVHDGKPAIWHLSTVLAWFIDEKGRNLDRSLLEVSRVTMQCNLIKETAGLDRKMSDRLKELVA